MIDREQAIKIVLESDVPGSGPLELVQREAKHIVDGILALPDPVHEAAREAEADLRSLRAELATLLGPRKPRSGVTQNEQWIAAVAEVLGRYERLHEAARELLALKDGPRDDEYRRRKPLAWEALRAALNPEEA